MVATTASYDNTIYQALPGLGYDGIVRVSVGGHYGTGALLYDGPSLIDGRIAGLASYSASLELGSIQPDIDTLDNASFGELGFWTRTSPTSSGSTRACDLPGPTPPAVRKTSKKACPKATAAPPTPTS